MNKFTQRNVTREVTVEKIKQYLLDNPDEVFFDGNITESCLIAKYTQKVFDDKELFVCLSTVNKMNGETGVIKEFYFGNDVQSLREEADHISSFQTVTSKALLSILNSQLS